MFIALKGQCDGNTRSFGKIYAAIHLLIHKLLLGIFFCNVGQGTVKEKLVVCFRGVQRNHLKKVSLTFLQSNVAQSRIGDASERFRLT